MNPTNSDFFAHDRIAELMQVSSDIHRGPEGGGSASRLSAALAGPTRWIGARRTAAASAAAAVIPSGGRHAGGGMRRPAARALG